MAPARESSASNKQAKRIQLKTWDAFAYWDWDTPLEAANCGICKTELLSICIECESAGKTNGKCSIARGICNHMFHSHCINNWIVAHKLCPLCCERSWELYETLHA